MLVAYIPVVEFLDEDNIRGTLINRLYHHCMEIVLQSLIKPGRYGVRMIDSDGNIRNCWPRVAVHLADYPEQCLINVTTRRSSPNTTASFHDLDGPDILPPRSRDWILNEIHEVCEDVSPDQVKQYQVAARNQSLNGVHKPYWRNLPGYQPELAACPDIMHGVIRCWRDHVYLWSRRLVGVREYDNRLRAIQPVPGYRHFNSGVQHLSQLTCREDRELQRTHVAIVAGSPRVTRKVLQNLRAFNDFIYIVQYRSHSEDTLRYLDDALSSFNETKDEYIRLGVRRGVNGTINHFKIPKLYTLRMFSPHVRLMGSSPQFSTEVIESNHRRLAKAPYKLTNRRNFAAQMCRRLDREERMLYHDELLEWCAKQDKLDAVNASLARYSPSYQERMLEWHRTVSQDEEESARVTNRFKRSTHWLSDQPHLPHAELEAIAQLYHLHDLPDTLRHYIYSSMTPQDRILLGGDPPHIACLDVWRKLRIRVHDVQDDELFSQAHSIEAVPPSIAFPYGHCHCVLVRWDEDAEETGISGESLYSLFSFLLI
jgi:Plavaka transposase